MLISPAALIVFLSKAVLPGNLSYARPCRKLSASLITIRVKYFSKVFLGLSPEDCDLKIISFNLVISFDTVCSSRQVHRIKYMLYDINISTLSKGALRTYFLRRYSFYNHSFFNKT